jgi:hypothetical protein
MYFVTMESSFVISSRSPRAARQLDVEERPGAVAQAVGRVADADRALVAVDRGDLRRLRRRRVLRGPDRRDLAATSRRT